VSADGGEGNEKSRVSEWKFEKSARKTRASYPATTPPLRLAASVPQPAPMSLPPE